MKTAKLFENGRSQAVRLPRECRFQGEDVMVNKIGEVVLLLPCDHPWAGFLSSFDYFTDDYMINGRDQYAQQERETL